MSAPDPASGGWRVAVRREGALLLAAAQFLTRLPLPAPAVWTPQTPTDSLRHLPTVGAGIGLAVGAVLLLAALWWPPEVAALLALWAGVALTGALHEDGWADSCDGLWGHASREKALAIMKDSRLGSYGVCGLVLMLGLRWSLLVQLAALSSALVVLTLVWAHAVSRALAVGLMASLPYAGAIDQAKAPDWVSRPAVQAARGGALVLAGLGGLLLWAGAPLKLLALTTLAVLALLVALRAFLRRRLGGYTGDTLGAAQQLAEALTLLLATALL